MKKKNKMPKNAFIYIILYLMYYGFCVKYLTRGPFFFCEWIMDTNLCIFLEKKSYDQIKKKIFFLMESFSFKY